MDTPELFERLQAEWLPIVSIDYATAPGRHTCRVMGCDVI